MITHRIRVVFVAFILLLIVLPLSVASAAVIEVIEQPLSNGYCSNGPGYGQSFTVGESGVITQVAFVPWAGGSGTLSIRAGAGSGGTLLHSQPVTWVAGGLSAPLQTVTLTSQVAVTAGQVYTFIPGGNGACGAINAYAGGIMYIESTPAYNEDVAFRIVIESGRPADPNAPDPLAEPFFQFSLPALSVEAFNNRQHPHNGTLPLDVFEPHWWGVKILTPANFPALAGIDLSTVEVLCLDEQGRWSDAYVKPWGPPEADLLQVWITQHGLCGIFPTSD